MVSIFQWRQHFLDFAILKSFKSLTGMPIVPFIVEIIHFIQQARVAERYQLILYTWMNSSDCVEKGILSFKPSIDCSIDLISELMEGYRNITQSHLKMSWPKIFLFPKKKQRNSQRLCMWGISLLSTSSSPGTRAGLEPKTPDNSILTITMCRAVTPFKKTLRELE